MGKILGVPREGLISPPTNLSHTQWLKLPTVWIPLPTARHIEVLGSMLRKTSATGNLVYDAHLAALAVEHGLILCSTDGDFARFPNLRWENPLQDY